VTKISQSSGPTNLVTDETIYKEWEDIMERAATTASRLEAKQDSGNINRTQSMTTLNEPLPQGTGSGSGLRCQVTILGVQKLKLEVEHDSGNIAKTQSKTTPNKASSPRTTSGGGLTCQDTMGDTITQTRFENVSKLSNDSLLIHARVDGKEIVITESSVKRDLQLADEEVHKEVGDRLVRAVTTASSLEAEQDNVKAVQDAAAAAHANNMKRASKGYIGVDIPLFPTMLVQGLQGEGSTVLVESHHTSSGDPTISQPQHLYPSRVPTPPHDSPLPGGHTPRSDEGSLTLNELTVLFTPTKVSSQEDQYEDQLGILSAAKILADADRVHTYSGRRKTVSTASRIISTAEETVSADGVSMQVSTAGMVQESTSSPRATKDKGKEIMTESEPKQTTTKLRERQERAGYEAAIRLQEQQDEEENQRIARDPEIAQRLQEEIDAAERQRMA
nr:hypothetical protein [Tanacetum cinerariifolium]